MPIDQMYSPSDSKGSTSRPLKFPGNDRTDEVNK